MEKKNKKDRAEGVKKETVLSSLYLKVGHE